MTRLLWQNFGDEAVVFNPLTWETHVVNATTANVLALLIEEPGAASIEEEELRGWLADAGNAGADTDALLRLLRELGLVASS